MTPQKLEIANELSKAIKSLKEEENFYNNATKIVELTFETRDKDNRSVNRYMKLGFIDFDVLKTLALKKIQTELEKAQKEFDAL